MPRRSLNSHELRELDWLVSKYGPIIVYESTFGTRKIRFIEDKRPVPASYHIIYQSVRERLSLVGD